MVGNDVQATAVLQQAAGDEGAGLTRGEAVVNDVINAAIDNGDGAALATALDSVTDDGLSDFLASQSVLVMLGNVDATEGAISLVTNIVQRRLAPTTATAANPNGAAAGLDSAPALSLISLSAIESAAGPGPTEKTFWL